MGLSIAKRAAIIRTQPKDHIGTNAQNTHEAIIGPMHTLHYLTGYPSQIQQQAQALLDLGRLGDYLLQRYPDKHDIQGDKALFQYANSLKQQYPVSYTHLTLPTICSV